MFGRARAVATALGPGGLTLYISFNAGGFFPGTRGLVAVLLLVALAAWILFAPLPFRSWSVALGLAGGSLILLAAWTLLSGTWSDSPARALLAAQTPLIYGLAALLFGLVLRGEGSLRQASWGVTAAFAVVCGAALTTRLLPDVFSPETNTLYQRLEYPISYWNGLGLIAAIGVLLGVHLASRTDGARLPRLLGAGLVPLFAVTVYFTFSRGAVLAAVVGLALYLALARPRGAVCAVLAAGAPTAYVLSAAYGAELLSDVRGQQAGEIEQGHEVGIALVVAIAAAVFVRALLLGWDRRLTRARFPALSSPFRLALIAALAVAAFGAAVAVDAPSEIDNALSGLEDVAPANQETDLRQRLTRVDSNSRSMFWRVALDQFQRDELRGEGAETFPLAWRQDREFEGDVLTAHSLYVETLGELGGVGLGLLALALAAMLFGLASRQRRSDRELAAVLLCGFVVWAAHAAVDWDWDLPAVTLWIFALGGAAVAREAAGEPDSRGPSTWVRVSLAVPLVVLAVVPFNVFSSQAWLDRAGDAFAAGNCRRASEDAAASTEALSIRPEPYQILAYCAIRARDRLQAVDAARRGLEADPRNPDLFYDVGLARAAAGMDPRRHLRRALELDPLNQLFESTYRRLSTDRPEAWRRYAAALADRFTSL